MASEILLKCRFSDSGRGFGFAEILEEDGLEDIFIAPDDTMGAMTGDTVLVHKFRRGEPGFTRGNEGEVTKILERGNTEIIGTLYMQGIHGMVHPDNEKLHTEIMVRGTDLAEAKPGDKVAVRITDYGKRRRGEFLILPEGFITAVFGRADTKEANYAAILHKNGVPTRFTDSVIWEAEDMAARPITEAGRRDLRGLPTLTIDSADAKDLDDAISLEKSEDGWRLYVHIADVSEYVKEGGEVDREAYARGTSVYFVDKVVPMLPEALSNGSCSLNGGVDRWALSAIIDLDKAGNPRAYDFAKSLIRSDVRGVYAEVNDLFEKGRDSAFAGKYAPVLDMLFDMQTLYGVLRRAAEVRGQLNLESTEAKILLDEKGIAVDIVPRTRGEAEMLIEQFMLSANVAAATWLTERGLPCLYRIHEDPPAEKIRAFAEFAHNMDLDVSGVKEGVSSRRLGQLLSEAAEKDIAEVVSGVMLRSLAKAKYHEKAGGHYGLALPLYCHFTSPIRRYPDLFVHRSISHALDATKRRPAHPAESARISSEAEVRAVTAERQIEDLYMAQYCCAHVGEEFDGIVSSVCSFGIFVRTDKLFEGLIPVENLFSRRDTAVYNESTMTLKAGSRIYRLGDPIRVRVTRAEVATGRIDMELAEPIPRENSFDGENRRRPRGGDRRPSSDKRGGSGKRTSYGDRRGKRGQPERRGQGKHTSHGGHRRGKK